MPVVLGGLVQQLPKRSQTFAPVALAAEVTLPRLLKQKGDATRTTGSGRRQSANDPHLARIIRRRHIDGRIFVVIYARET